MRAKLKKVGNKGIAVETVANGSAAQAAGILQVLTLVLFVERKIVRLLIHWTVWDP